MLVVGLEILQYLADSCLLRCQVVRKVVRVWTLVLIIDEKPLH